MHKSPPQAFEWVELNPLSFFSGYLNFGCTRAAQYARAHAFKCSAAVRLLVSAASARRPIATQLDDNGSGTETVPQLAGADACATREIKCVRLPNTLLAVDFQLGKHSLNVPVCAKSNH
jgi:hypothetical protein